VIVGVLDPILFEAPAGDAESVVAWLRDISEWATRIRDGPVVLVSPRDAEAAVLAQLFERRAQLEDSLRPGTLGFPDVVQAIEALRAQAMNRSLGGLAWNAVTTTPGHHVLVNSTGSDLDFPAACGDAAVQRRDAGAVVGVVAAARSWPDESPLLVEGEIALWEVDNELAEPDEGERFVREYVGVWVDEQDLHQQYLSAPAELLDHLAVAVRVAYHTAAGAPLSPEREFGISAGFASTLRAMNYDVVGNRGRLLTCLRAMAMIAACRAAEVSGLEAHFHKVKAAGGEPLRDSSGRRLYRGYLAQHSPNAHRLFWWEGAKPEFLGIAGHDDPPPL
jgi:hypothetical protein